MRDSRFTKSENRELRELAGAAYEAELGDALDELLAEFGRWKQGEIGPVELSEAIHEYHQGPNRELYKLYNGLPEADLVARAVVLGLLDATKLRPELMEKLESSLDFFRRQLVDDADEPPSEEAE